MNKYRLTENTIEYDGRTLYQIESLVDIYSDGFSYLPLDTIKQNKFFILDNFEKHLVKGELGGYIESENNLSQFGACWVSQNAKVFGNALIENNAYVTGDAVVCDDVTISGCSQIWGNARITCNAKITGHSKIYDNVIIFGNCYILSSTISENAQIFHNAIIRFENINRDAYITSNDDHFSIAISGYNDINLTVFKSKKSIFICSNLFNPWIETLDIFTFLNEICKNCFFKDISNFKANNLKEIFTSIEHTLIKNNIEYNKYTQVFHILKVSLYRFNLKNYLIRHKNKKFSLKEKLLFFFKKF